MDVYRNNRLIDFSENNSGSNGSDQETSRGFIIRTVAIFMALVLSVTLSVMSLISAKRMVNDYAETCRHLQTQLEQVNERNEELLVILNKITD